jgi:hypothetical protein
MEPLTHYTIAIVYQQRTPEQAADPPPLLPPARKYRLFSHLRTRLRSMVADITADRQANVTSSLIECYQKQE